MWISGILPGTIFVLLSSLAIYFFYRAYQTRKLQQLKQELEAVWAREDHRLRDMERIAAYSNHMKALQQLDSRSKKRMTDLNMDAVFSKLDRCKTKVGQQYLYAMLQHPIKEQQKLDVRNNGINYFEQQKESRLAAQIELQRLNKQLSYSIPNIIFNWKLETGPNKWLVTTLSLLPVVIIALCIWVSKAYVLLLALSFFVNLLFHYRNKSRVEFFISPFSQIPALRTCALRLSKVDKHFQRKEVRAACDKLTAFGRYQFLLQSEKPSQHDFSAFLWLFLEYFKITFLVEINLLDRCLEISQRAKDEIHTLYKYIAELDSYQSIASYRAGLNYYCTPEFDNSKAQIAIKDAFHPLIEPCEANSLVTETKGMLITGSNMSGKTTFIRTIAINAILAQTIYTVCAKHYQSSFLNVYTSIGIQDNLLEGKSYYREELDAIQYFVQQAETTSGFNLFVMDELFKGTNTMERIAGAKGVLQYLIKGNNLVMVATHDLELADLLSPAYSLYHFEESVEDGGYVFDYKLKKGVLKSRNAIRLLEVSGFPAEIVGAANAYLDMEQASARTANGAIPR